MLVLAHLAIDVRGATNTTISEVTGEMQGYSTHKICRPNGRFCTYDSECWGGCCDVSSNTLAGALAESYGGVKKRQCQDLLDKNLLGVVYTSRTSCNPNPSGKKAPKSGACYAFWIILIIVLPILAGCACVIGTIYGIYTLTCKKKSVHQPAMVPQV